MNIPERRERSLLTEKQAAQIKRLWSESNFAQSDIARLLDIAPSDVCDVVNGRCFATVPAAPF